MRVLACPTAFKGTLTAAEAARACAAGVRAAVPDAGVACQPLSDGGPGLLDALRAAEPGSTLRRVRARGPLGEPVEGRLLWTPGPRGGRGERAGKRGERADEGGGSAGEESAGEGGGRVGAGEPEVVVESADACGIHLTGAEPRPLEVHTAGVGDLIRAAIEAGAARVVVGLGGSATTEGGTGMARAFGYRFLDGEGRELPPGGGSLRRLARIEAGRPPDADVLALADVVNPLNGMRGAARAYGPQKGADAASLDMLIDGLERLERRMRIDLGVRVGDLPGSGAAGGLGAGCVAFLGARLERGAEWVLRRVRFAERLGEVDLVVTGEGAYDATTREGKILEAVLAAADEAGVPVLVACGRVEGPVPGAAAALDGGGSELDAAGLGRLVARGVAGLDLT